MQFIKRAPQGASALKAEAQGLETLSRLFDEQDIALYTPKIIALNDRQLVLEYINTKPASQQQFETLGRNLAKAHLCYGASYGFHADNFIGLNPQPNIQSQNWGEFFLNYRLIYQINLIQDTKLKSSFNQVLNNNSERLIAFLNGTCQGPSLLHGDLWNGNVLFSHDDKVWLIDPAVYYGDREAEIAMTEVFGGFSPVFYSAYTELAPLHKEYETKRDIFNLYHYLNHFNLFGNGYLSACQKGLKVIESL
ncbi:fructosamine kinase family protein [Glaciecola sp. 1036]|uniref:fructosamine kinase family protein n=1 Tax=Alteromonadaceae TaxID=72275 RepID=UPI003CFC6991